MLSNEAKNVNKDFPILRRVEMQTEAVHLIYFGVLHFLEDVFFAFLNHLILYFACLSTCSVS